MATRRKLDEPNRHVIEYLTYYASLPHSPNYAVMLSGPWGVGKTHLVKKFLEGLNKVGKKPVYVSLYGLSTIDEIDQALFQAIYPVLGHKATKIGARLTKTVLGRFGINPNFRLDELLNKFTADLYVFDDLERCEAPINTTLGYINDFVEHEGCKVVVIGNETELSSREGYAKRREKLIGKTLEVQSDFEEAFQFFLSTPASSAEVSGIITVAAHPGARRIDAAVQCGLVSVCPSRRIWPRRRQLSRHKALHRLGARDSFAP